MIRRPPRSTPLYSSAASDVYKRQEENLVGILCVPKHSNPSGEIYSDDNLQKMFEIGSNYSDKFLFLFDHAYLIPVSYTHLRAHETPEHLVCRLLLEKKKKKNK